MLYLEENFKKIENKIQQLPPRLNFKIGEVAKILSLPTHVLRYWEKEFSELKPQKFTNNQRLYTRKDIGLLFLIKSLLYEEKFSTKGLKKHLSSYLKQMKTKHKNISQTSSNNKPTSEITRKKETSNLEKKAQTLLNTLSKMKHQIQTLSL